jgi:hypothetical protein
VLFELPDLKSHCRLRHVQRFGGLREAEEAGDRVEYLKTAIGHWRSVALGNNKLHLYITKFPLPTLDRHLTHCHQRKNHRYGKRLPAKAAPSQGNARRQCGTG